MAEQRARRDSNRVTTLIGVDSIAFTDPTTVAVNATSHALLTETYLSPQPVGGWSKVISASQGTGITTIKASAGKFGGYFIYNPNNTATYMQVFDANAGVILGTTTPDMTFGIPATSGANVELTNGVNMVNGIQIAVTTTATGAGASSSGMDITIYYL